MISDTWFGAIGHPHRARRRLFSFAGMSLARMSLAATTLAACADESPADEAIAAELSTREVLSLCDELRDAVESNPRRCGSDDAAGLPSNETCANADLSACSVTVRELRRCNERALRAPCLFLVDDFVSPLGEQDAVVECQQEPECDPFLPFF